MNMFTYYLHRHAPGNVAVWDRILRALPALIVVTLFLTGVLNAAIALLFGLPALMLLGTSATGKCGAYYALKTGTQRDANGDRVTGHLDA